MHENSFVSESQTVTLEPNHRPPEVNGRLPEDVLPEVVKKKHVSDCQRYIGQLMWLATRTRPDISAVRRLPRQLLLIWLICGDLSGRLVFM